MHELLCNDIMMGLRRFRFRFTAVLVLVCLFSATFAYAAPTINVDVLIGKTTKVSKTLYYDTYVDWQVEDSGIATIKEISRSQLGSTVVAGVTLEGKSVGSTVLTGYDDNQTLIYEAVIRVIEPEFTFYLEPARRLVEYNGTFTLTPIIEPVTSETIQWSSNNSTYVSVNTSGVVTGRMYGSATITATLRDLYTATCNVYTVLLNKGTLTKEIKAGASEAIKVSITSPSGINISSFEHTYTSQNAEIASVNEDGIIRGNRVGNTKVTANIGGVDIEYTVYVTEDQHSIANETIVKEATCTEEGSREGVCDYCGQTVAVAIPVGAHTYDNYQITPATCMADGSITGDCSICGAVLNETIPCLGHDWPAWQVTDATCTTAGYKERTCTRCREKETQTTSPALDHNWSYYWTVVREATTERDGLKERSCTRAGCVEKQVSIIPRITRPVTRVRITERNTPFMLPGERMILEALYEPLDTTDDVTAYWYSSNTNVATVLNGVVTFVNPGRAVITVKIGNASASHEINVPELDRVGMVHMFVNRLYHNVLGREADPLGICSWRDQLLYYGQTGAETASGFIFSQEYKNRKQSDSSYVEMLYLTLMDRKADTGGKTYWMEKLSQGLSRQYVFAGFVNSVEFTSICKKYKIDRGTYYTNEIVDRNPAVTAFVARMYTVCLGRGFDISGLYDWTGRLLNLEISGGQLARGFFYSQEFVNKNHSNQTFVTLAYRSLLNREPDAAGLAYWTNRLAQGQPRNVIIDGFINSVEFGNLCNSYGIVR